MAEAKKVLQARAQERQAAEQAEYEATLRQREQKAERPGRKPRDRPPTPPAPGEPQDKDQYNFTDPKSWIMKNSSSDGFEQAYNAQVAVDQDSYLIVACSLSNHPNDKAEVEPTLDALPAALGAPAAAALDNGFFSEKNIAAFKRACNSAATQLNAPNRRHWTGKQGATDPAAGQNSRASCLSRRKRGHICRRPRSLRQAAKEAQNQRQEATNWNKPGCLCRPWRCDRSCSRILRRRRSSFSTRAASCATSGGRCDPGDAAAIRTRDRCWTISGLVIPSPTVTPTRDPDAALRVYLPLALQQ